MTREEAKARLAREKKADWCLEAFGDAEMPATRERITEALRDVETQTFRKCSLMAHKRRNAATYPSGARQALGKFGRELLTLAHRVEGKIR